MAQRFTPKLNTRGTAGYTFAELSLALGPQQIAVTGDNSYETLYGRAWLMVWDETDNSLKLYRQDAVGAWTRVTTNLPSVFDAPVPTGARRVSFAFDQSARVIIAYELGGFIYVTRWDTTLGQYLQNVTFAGADPTILMDATVADPLGYPNLADDGWSVREAYYAGIPVYFLWIPNGQLLRSAIPDSDALLFYLSADRLQVRCRVQRQLYLTENVIHTFAEPVVLDRAVALAAKYELFLSNAAGEKLPNMLISAPYFEEMIIAPAPVDPVGAQISDLPDWHSVTQSLILDEEDAMTVQVDSLPDWSHVAALAIVEPDERVNALVDSLPDWSHVANLFTVEVSEAVVPQIDSLPDWSHVAAIAITERTERLDAGILSLPAWTHQEV